MAGKRGAKILRKKKSQMFGIEYPFLFGFVILLVIIALVGSEEWNSSFRADRVSTNARILAAASDEVYSAGPGSVKCVAINNPKGLVSGRAVGNEIIFVLQAKGQENDIASTTKSRGIGAIPISEGQAIICVRNGIDAGGSSSSSSGDDTEPLNILYPNGATEDEGDGCIPVGGDPDCGNPAEFNIGTSGQCGDGISDSNEGCEVGESCGAGFRCNEACQCEAGGLSNCGDGDQDLGEECDPNGGSSNCVSGNPIVCPGATTLGNPGNGATLYAQGISCSGSCTCEYSNNDIDTCGGAYDTKVSSPNSCGQEEQCRLNADCAGFGPDWTCNSICLCDPPSTCGDGNQDAGEQCGEPGLSCQAGYTCNSKCQCILATCGNSVMDPGEECEKHTPCDTPYVCNTGTCLCQGCGNNRVDAGEECDDGNTANGDGCSSTCQTETACGATTAPSCGGACPGGQICVSGPYQWCECKDPCAQDPDACNLGSCEQGHCERTQEQGKDPVCACVKRKVGEVCSLSSQCETNRYCVNGFCGTPPGSGPGYVGNACASGMTGTSCGGTTYDGSLCVPMNGPGSPSGTNCIAMTNGGSYNGGVPIGQYGGECTGGMGGSCNPGQGSCIKVTESANPDAWICD
ncbi:MAG TPA: hypothetical protein VJC07_05470 [Candidatus Nanoarchaeia archaeon]|nr:hypothetical protein [Candidatus Nanoarchaeia archaeon]